MKFIRAVGFIVIFFGSLPAFASWERLLPGESPRLTFDCEGAGYGIDVKPVFWSNQKNEFAICSYEPIPKGKTFLLNSSFRMIAELNGQRIEIANEAEVGSKPRRIVFVGDNVELHTYMDTGKSELYQETIRCAGSKCVLSPKVCVLKEPSDGQKHIAELQALFKKTSPKKKTAMWTKYFFEDNQKEAARIGNQILMEAMLGNKDAENIVMMDVDLDGAWSETRAQYGSDIEEVQAICAKPSRK